MPSLVGSEMCIRDRNTIPDYLAQGGKVLFNPQFPNFTDPRGLPLDFAPIDSLITVYEDGRNGFISRVFQSSKIVSQDSMAYPHLYIEQTTNIGVGIYAFEPSATAMVLFRLDNPKSGETWLGTPVVSSIGSAQNIVFITVPLHLLNGADPSGNRHLVTFFTKVFRDLFGL